ncbi:hypothetical protein [Pseudonocardia acidicola]|uniref:hypothetical protein n=1 Tax=Pseudonocardia acidicola TaxID=2724939 RepID=UPI001B7D20C2|nr:hypothetical protein [Pseudonocardia acidicola]
MAPARARTPQVEESQGEPQQLAEPAAGAAAEESGRREDGDRTATVHLPFVTAQFRRPDLHLPRLGRREASEAVSAVADRARSLSPAELAYYAGLGLLAVVDLIEWPVAIAVGAGTALARARGRGPEEAPSDRAGSDEGAEESRSTTNASS